MSIEPERRKKELMRERVIYFFKTRTYFSTCRRLLLSQFSLNFLDCVRKGIVCFCSPPCLFPNRRRIRTFSLSSSPQRVPHASLLTCVAAHLLLMVSVGDRKRLLSPKAKTWDSTLDFGGINTYSYIPLSYLGHTTTLSIHLPPPRQINDDLHRPLRPSPQPHLNHTSQSSSSPPPWNNLHKNCVVANGASLATCAKASKRYPRT
ncbi:hypothetical protein CABS01_11136 [Colletotrichum abscissum]|uniref:uncharacterized protein n=1 Tax=Colletotrichum abscissum TaxID=1671311 RepID=UPI0027D497B5|nr:uncharacterized protein CABS01_11136 [Colletotrichum abscissum]KAK1494908.1 hypothetical protein CABS01_11136 [Colletotrichum abscissum]